MNRKAAIAVLALFLLSSCHDKQKVDNQTFLAGAIVLRDRISVLEDQVKVLEDRMDKIDKGGQ
jgi:hypothetical protein